MSLDASGLNDDQAHLDGDWLSRQTRHQMPSLSQNAIKQILYDRPKAAPFLRPGVPNPEYFGELLNVNWGHPLLSPEGVEIRLPQWAFTWLGGMGLLTKNRESGLRQILPLVHAFMEPECDGLMGGLRQLLGVNMEGPKWLICECRQCQRREEEADKTPAPRGPEVKPRGRYWLKVIRATQ